MKTISKTLQALDGKFGNKVLKPNYRFIWRLLTYGSLFLLIVRFIAFPILNWWEDVVRFLNYVIWG